MPARRPRLAPPRAARGAGRVEDSRFPDLVQAAAGDVLFFNYLTIHGSGVNRSTRTRRNVLFEYRDPADPPLLRDGVEEHVDWGAGTMVAGSNPGFWEWRSRIRVEQRKTAEKVRRERL